MSETHLIKAPSNMSNLEMEMEESMYNKYDQKENSNIHMNNDNEFNNFGD